MVADSSKRRFAVPFDPEYFARLSSRPSVEERFRIALEKNLWSAKESRSGIGSSLDQTKRLRELLPKVLLDLGATSMLDIPCGDFNWMSRVDLGDIAYLGADILPEIVEANQHRYENEHRRFVVGNVLSSGLPRADVVFCRDCLVHFSLDDALHALENLRRSGARSLLATTFPREKRNVDIVTGDWRPLNLELPPFSLPRPQLLLNEECSEQNGLFDDKSIGLWSLRDLLLVAPRPYDDNRRPVNRI